MDVETLDEMLLEIVTEELKETDIPPSLKDKIIVREVSGSISIVEPDHKGNGFKPNEGDDKQNKVK